MKSNLSVVTYKGMTIRYLEDADPKNCRAITKKGKPCKNPHLEDEDFCHVHSEKKEDKIEEGKVRICQGLKRNRQPCKAPAMKGSLYCREDHNPEILTTDTDEFRKPNLRSLAGPGVRMRTANKDAFTDLPLDQEGLMYDLDHFWEVNIGRDIYDHVSRDIKSGAANSLKTRIRDSFNQSFNLGFTEGSVNNAKCAAVVEFSNDLKFKEAHDEGLPHYLRQRFTQKAVTRGDVARISARIVVAYDDLREHLAKEYDGMPYHDETMDRLDFTFEKMKLQK
jgi:hypothetical protein